jgi:Xaa-Pro aminopeptidase
MDYERRLNGLREQMEQRGLGLVAYGPCPELQYLTGLLLDWRCEADVSWSAATVFVPPDAPPALVLPETCADRSGQTWISDVRILEEGADLGALVRAVLGDLGATGGRIALGKRLSTRLSASLRSLTDGAELCEAAGLMDALRMIKDPQEVALLRAVARLTDEVFEAVIPRIREGVTQPELEAEVELAGRRLGASGVSFAPAVIFTQSGSQPAPEPFTYPREKGLVAGTSIAFDIGFVKDGYCSDFGRSLYFGDAPEDVSSAYEALQQGMVQTVGRMRDGSVRLCDLFPAIERTLDGLGYGDYLRARLPDGVLGHSIGIDVHEDPWISPRCDEAIRANMVLALEPKLWHSGEYYLRVEDVVLVGEDGCEFLTSFDRTTFQL